VFSHDFGNARLVSAFLVSGLIAVGCESSGHQFGGGGGAMAGAAGDGGRPSSWLASPAANDRTLKVSLSAPADRTATLLSPLATDGSQRPVLVLDYSAKCAGNACPKLTQ
jgi:hypothetical protein